MEYIQERYSKNNSENAITSIEWLTQVYKHNKRDIDVRIAHMYQCSFRKVTLGRKTEEKIDYKFGSIFNMKLQKVVSSFSIDDIFR